MMRIGATDEDEKAVHTKLASKIEFVKLIYYKTIFFCGIDNAGKPCYNDSAFLMEKSKCFGKTSTRATKAEKFTDKGAGEGEKLRKAVRIYSDEPEKDAPPAESSEPATGFNRLETKHHQRHAKEMGFKNTKEYEKAAVEFLQ